MTKIKEGIKALINDHGEWASIICTVKSVDADACTVDVSPDNGDADILEVAIKAGTTDKEAGIVLLPKVGSTVVVSVPEEDVSNAYISLYSEVDEIRIGLVNGIAITFKEDENIELKNKKTSVLIGADGTIALHGDALGGLIKINELKSELAKANLFMKTFQQQLLVPVTEPGNGAPSAFQLVLNTAMSSLSLPEYSNIENEKVKHG